MGGNTPETLTGHSEATETGFTIYGVVPSLKNSRDIGRRPDPDGGKPQLFPTRNPEIIRYMSDFAAQLPRRCRLGLEGVFVVHMRVWYPNWRRDMDVEIVYDLLQSCGVIENDRFIVGKHAWKYVDPKQPPRAIIHVQKVGPRPIKKSKSGR